MDDQIAILGSRNHGARLELLTSLRDVSVVKRKAFSNWPPITDTQSWFHSQEVNATVDSPELVSSWLHDSNANQNTPLHGRVSVELSDVDGIWAFIWRGEDGEIVQASEVAASSLLKRVFKVIGRIRGTDGF